MREEKTISHESHIHVFVLETSTFERTLVVHLVQLLIWTFSPKFNQNPPHVGPVTLQIFPHVT